MDLVVAVYDAAKRFPPDERFALTDQIRRAVVSIPSNIAKGNGRESERASLHFCLIAHGSLREVETQIQVAHRLSYLDQEQTAQLRRPCDAVGIPLRGLISYLRSQINTKGVREDAGAPYDTDT